MNYFYEATDSTGQTVMGRLDASSEAEVRQRLQQMGYQPQAVAANAASQTVQPASPHVASHPTLMNQGLQAAQVSSPAVRSEPVTVQTASRSSGIILSGTAARTMGVSAVSSAAPAATAPRNVSNLGGVNDRDRLFFFQQLAALAKSGMTIFASLENLGARTPNRNLSKVTKEMAEGARTGGRISDVMERYPRIFEEHVVGLVRAGELGGFLEIALSEIALTYEQNIALYRGSWIPKLMAIQALYALALAIPLFSDLLNVKGLESGSIVPGLTLYLQHEAILLPLTFLLIQAVKYGWRHMQLPGLRYLRDSWTLKVPPFGDLHRQAALAAFIRMLRRLYHAGVGPVPAWQGAMATSSNAVIRERLAASYEMMQRGRTLPDAFAATGLFTGNIEQLLMTGQLSGQVVESLDQIAEFYQERVDEAAKKARFGMLRLGVLALLVLGGATVIWMAKTYFAAVFRMGDSMGEGIVMLLKG